MDGIAGLIVWVEGLPGVTTGGASVQLGRDEVMATWLGDRGRPVFETMSAEAPFLAEWRTVVRCLVGG